MTEGKHSLDKGLAESGIKVAFLESSHLGAISV